MTPGTRVKFSANADSTGTVLSRDDERISSGARQSDAPDRGYVYVLYDTPIEVGPSYEYSYVYDDGHGAAQMQPRLVYPDGPVTGGWFAPERLEVIL